MKISLLGCGWLGFPLALRLLERGYRVKGSTTDPAKLSVLRAAGIEPLWLQLTPEPKGTGWDYLLDCEVLIINIPPRAERAGPSFHPAQLRHLAALIAHSPIQRIIYVSSTSIYPDLNREVTEDDVTQPQESAAPAFIEAEMLLQQLAPDTLILRCGGLMGYDRIPAKYVAGKKDITTGELPVNYIHRDDVIGIMEAFLQTPAFNNEVYNLVAPFHPLRREVYLKSALPFGYEPPVFLPSKTLPFKVVSSAKLQTHLAYSFVYPDPLDFFYQL